MKAITHRDQIHGDVRYDPLAVALLNTEALQRLGRIYQLGYAHLVYRGGTHTRLSHVMGAFHVAGQLVDLLRQNYLEAKHLPPGAVPCAEFLPQGRVEVHEDIRWDVLRHLVRWAGLLHDVAHIPLGHTLEDEFDGIYIRHDDFGSPRIPHLWHETSPGTDSEIRQVFRRDELLPDSFRSLDVDGERAWQAAMLICLHREGSKGGTTLTFRETLEGQDESKVPFIRILKSALDRTQGTIFFPYMADIVGNTICADYLDYLRRDPSNVGLDVLRDDRVASRFVIGKDGKGSLRMALTLVDRRGKPRLDTCTGVVELVRQRYRFAEIIYYHKTKVAASAMLAKVFALVGKPNEVGPSCLRVDIDEVQDLARSVVSDGRQCVANMRQKYFPSVLLDPEIGDETLLLWMQDRAWRILEEASLSKDIAGASCCLRGLSLLQALVRRNLYKVSLTIGWKTYAELSPGSTEVPEIEGRIQATLQMLRNNEPKRSELESRMAAAAGWPDDSLLLYVPPRKSQAKGIETGALDKGDVVTLGMHSAVKAEVSRLNERYKELWRMILLVHPKYQGEVIGLSNAVDVLVTCIWPSIDKHAMTKAIRDAAWFHYVTEKRRPAAVMYKRLVQPREPEWACFEEAGYDTTDGTVSTDEHAERAVLLSRLTSQSESLRLLKERFGIPGSLSERISELRGHPVEGPEAVDADRARLAAIETIAKELLPQPVKTDREKPQLPRMDQILRLFRMHAGRPKQQDIADFRLVSCPSNSFTKSFEF